MHAGKKVSQWLSCRLCHASYCLWQNAFVDTQPPRPTKRCAAERVCANRWRSAQVASPSLTLFLLWSSCWVARKLWCFCLSRVLRSRVRQGSSEVSSLSTRYGYVCGNDREPAQFAQKWWTMVGGCLSFLALFSKACKHCHTQCRRWKHHAFAYLSRIVTEKRKPNPAALHATSQWSRPASRSSRRRSISLQWFGVGGGCLCQLCIQWALAWRAWQANVPSSWLLASVGPERHCKVLPFVATSELLVLILWLLQLFCCHGLIFVAVTPSPRLRANPFEPLGVAATSPPPALHQTGLCIAPRTRSQRPGHLHPLSPLSLGRQAGPQWCGRSGTSVGRQSNADAVHARNWRNQPQTQQPNLEKTRRRLCLRPGWGIRGQTFGMYGITYTIRTRY